MNVGETVYLGDGNYVHVDNIIVEAPSITNCYGTRIRLEGQLMSNNPRSKGYCDTDTAQEVYRTFKMTPERVIYNDPATIVLWKDGTKTVVKCMEGDTYNPEVGLAMCVCKKLYGSKYHKFFKHYTKDAPTRPLQGNVTEATEASYYSPVDEVINLIKAVFDDTKGESK